MLHQLGDLLAGQTGPVNWQVARQGALQVIGADAGTTAADTAAIADAMRLADIWLDPVTTLPSGVRIAEAWSRRRWLEATQPGWARLVEPVATRVAGAMGQAVPEQMRAMAAPLMGVLGQVGGLMFGGQLGQALGGLAREVTTSTEIGVPLGPGGVAALLPEGVAAFAEGLDVPLDQVRLFLALHEAAHQRLFNHVPWLAGHLFEAVHRYADGIAIDTSRIEELAGSLDPSDMESMQQALAGGLFSPEVSPAQQQALTRLETALALVEGWVDVLVGRAASGQLPSLPALQETMRRRRATGGPAEQTFATLVGLQLRPRRLRDAAAVWQLLTERRGEQGRDELWSHPDLLPSPDDLDDPLGFAEPVQASDLDRDIAALEDGDPPGEPD
jgi:putative hydrolase